MSQLQQPVVGQEQLLFHSVLQKICVDIDQVQLHLVLAPQQLLVLTLQLHHVLTLQALLQLYQVRVTGAHWAMGVQLPILSVASKEKGSVGLRYPLFLVVHPNPQVHLAKACTRVPWHALQAREGFDRLDAQPVLQ